MFLIAILRNEPCPPQTIAVFQINYCWLLEQQTGLDTSKNAQVDIDFLKTVKDYQNGCLLESGVASAWLRNGSQKFGLGLAKRKKYV
jgi:hypothetical protein